MIRTTEEHDQIREMVASFADNELWPNAPRIDVEAEFPAQALEQLAELGILGIAAPEDSGGIGGDMLMLMFALEELARGCASTAQVVAAHAVEALLAIDQLGTEEQRKQYLPRLAAGEILGTLAISEMEAEVDAGSITCVATRDGDDWVLDGVKKYVTAGSEAGLYLVVARTGEAAGTDSLSAFLVDGGAQAAGVRIVGVEDTLGMRGCRMAEVAFEGCRLPATALLGDREGIFDGIAKILAGGRLAVAAIATGVGRRANEYALQYASERKAFGRTIDRFEAIRNMFADAATRTEAGRLLTYQAASRRDAGESFMTEASMAKLHASEAAYLTTKDAVQVLGGNGYSREYPVERMYRDAETLEVLGAPGDLHRRLISRVLIGDRTS